MPEVPRFHALLEQFRHQAKWYWPVRRQEVNSFALRL